MDVSWPNWSEAQLPFGVGMMEVVFFWLLFSLVVGVAANTRGRSGIGWFFLAAVISPLIAGLFVVALPRLKAETRVGPIFVDRPGPPKLTAPHAAFEPEGVYAGFPYRVLGDGAVEAMTPGGLIRFKQMEHFVAMANGQSAGRRGLP